MAVWPSFRLKTVRNRLSKNVSDNSAYSDDELSEINHGVEEAHFFCLLEVFWCEVGFLDDAGFQELGTLGSLE